MYIDVVMGFVGKDYRIGVGVVPILLLANLFLGIFYNLSIWYKITDQTKYGAYISMIGAAVTLILNFVLVPTMGYMGAAWATLICYFTIMFISYLLGQKYYPINYNLKKIGLFFGLALLLYFISVFADIQNIFLKYFIHSIFIIIYLAVFIFTEKKNIVKLIAHKNWEI